MKCLDPTTMSAVERLAELGDILARGVQRFLARTSKPNPNSSSQPRNHAEQLDVDADVEAQCGHPAECHA